MLKITVKGTEFFDEENQEFITKNDVDLELEHSLVSLSKWESKYEKPFLGKDEKSTEEVMDYISMMILTPEVSSEVFARLDQGNIAEIQQYIDKKNTATWFNEKKDGRPNRETITAELIYFWMISHQIPFECQTWHLRRLLTLIQVCNVKNSKPKKQSASEMAARNRELNAQRRSQYGTKG